MSDFWSVDDDGGTPCRGCFCEGCDDCATGLQSGDDCGCPLRSADRDDEEGVELRDGPACRVCGCTEDEGCPGGCTWVPDPWQHGELCSACLPLDPAEARP